MWKNFEPTEAFSLGSDYGEYYDRKYDTNGGLRISREGKQLMIDPSVNGNLNNYPEIDDNENTRIYQFNKQKLEAFIYDLKKLGGKLK